VACRNVAKSAFVCCSWALLAVCCGVLLAKDNIGCLSADGAIFCCNGWEFFSRREINSSRREFSNFQIGEAAFGSDWDLTNLIGI